MFDVKQAVCMGLERRTKIVILVREHGIYLAYHWGYREATTLAYLFRVFLFDRSMANI
jgi:hypothetical protein